MARKHYRKPTKRKYNKGARRALTEDAKARSMQSSWRKATNSTETLTIADAKKIISNPPKCPYCKLQINWPLLSIDHMVPRSLDGPCEAANLIWCCRICNLSKGDLTDVEFIALMEFLNQHPRMKDSVLSRLRAGGAVYGRRKRRSR